MARDKRPTFITLRRRPASLEGLSVALFCITAMVPLAWMFGQFLVAVVRSPELLSKILLDSRQLALLGRSLGIAGSATLLAILLGAPVAAILAARDLPLRRLFFLLVLVPLLIPSYVNAGAWIHLLSPHGAVNQALTWLWGPSAALTVQSVPGCIWCLGLSFFPIAAVVLATGLLCLDGSLQDVARLCVGPWGVFWHSTLPQLRAHLVAAVCLILIFALGQYGVPSLLGINTYPVEIFAQFSAFYDEVAAVARALPLTVLVVLLVLVQRRTMGTREYVSVTPRSDVQPPVTLGRARPYAILFLVVLFIVTVVLPFGSVLVHAEGIAKVLSTAALFRDAIWFTGLLAFAAGVISVFIAFFLAHFLAAGGGRTVRVLDALCWLPVAIPGTVVALGLIRAAAAIPILQRVDTFGLFLLLAYVGMFCAFAIRVLYAAYRRTDPNIEEVAALDCPRWYQRCWYVDLRIHADAIVVSLLLVFVLAVGELNATVLLAPPGKDTLSVSIDNLLHYGASATASAFCLMEAGLVLAVTAGYLVLAALYRRMSHS